MIARVIITTEVEDHDEAIIWETEVANAMSSMCVRGDVSDVELFNDDMTEEEF